MTKADPAIGLLKMSISEFAELWTGFIVVFEPGTYFEKGNYTKGTFLRFFDLLKGQTKLLFSILIFSIVVIFIGIFGTFLFEIVIDNFVNDTQVNQTQTSIEDEHDHNEDTLPIRIIHNLLDTGLEFNSLFVLVLVLYFISAILQIFRGRLMAMLAKNIDVSLIMKAFNRVVDMPVSTINTRQTGEYLSRFSDASLIRNAISGSTLTLMLDTLTLALGAYLLFQQNSLMFIISLGMIGVYLCIILLYRKPITRVNHLVMENNAKVQSYLKESIDGIETVKAVTAEDTVKENTTNRFRVLLQHIFKGNIIYTTQDVLTGQVQTIGTLCVIWVGFNFVITGNLSLGSLMTFYAMLSLVFSPIKNLVDLQPQMQSAIVASERLNDILLAELEETNVDDKYEIDKPIEQITFENINFGYGNRGMVLKDINFTVNKGQKIAIVGESGSGKTTIAKMLIGFYQPMSGDIKINHVSIRNYNKRSIRRNIAYLDQTPFFFSDSIINNLRLGNTNISDNEITMACHTSQVDKFIESLPLRYNTYLDENGKNLSGGQKQRLSIARALLSNPQILIMDEATSNLDTITESCIKDSILGLEEMTCVIIAHRLSTIKQCDTILVMKDGEMIESGSHQELINMKGYYCSLIDPDDH